MVIREGLEPSTQWLKVVKGISFAVRFLHFPSLLLAFSIFQFIIVLRCSSAFGRLGTQQALKLYNQNRLFENENKRSNSETIP